MNSHLDRRSFLLTSVAASAAPAHEIRTAHIGVGQRGGRLLQQTLKQENVKIAAICDNYPLALDQGLSAASRDMPQSFTDWKKVVDLKDVDAVYIATPCYLHAEMSAACLEAGKYVYCEKPLAITPEQVDLVLRAARRSKAFLQIGQQLRYYPNMREAIRQLHEENILGGVYAMRAQRDSGRSRRGSGREPSAQRQRRDAWYADVEQSGDKIVENAVHNIDVCNWIADSRPISAYGYGKKYFPEPIPPGTIMTDGFAVEYIYENDIHLQYSQLAFHPRNLKEIPNGMWYTIFGEKGSVFMTHSAATYYDLYGENEGVDMLPADVKGVRENAVEDFLACIREKRQPFGDVKVGAVAALTGIMGREAIYRKGMCIWKELGVEV